MSYARQLIADRLANHPDRDRIITLVAVADQALPTPCPDRSVLDGYETDGLIKSSPYGWQITEAGYAVVDAAWRAEVAS